ncbi:hypothetical protein AVEN_127354-1 [Araneus ventricosus]|uniref:Uncharacterized protein n=1 Tax=Araneus ventricosus TaxID=182803 RepID=A0A4Y2QUC5_ARAVE|nr:hypothetical protein AVEN_127354-1 [Araneus ventricosus]
MQKSLETSTGQTAGRSATKFGTKLLLEHSQPFSMKWPSGVPWTMPKWCTLVHDHYTWSTTYVVEKCDVMWKLSHPLLTGGSERLLQKLTFGIDLSNYNVG